MPVGAYAGANVSIGNGVTTLFAYNFKILDQAHLEVKVDGVLKVLGADYTVTGVGLSAGGNVIFGVAPVNGTVVQRARKVPYTRSQDYQVNGDFKEVTVDTDLDLLEMQVQQLAADAARALKAPLSVIADQVLSDADWAARASRFLGFNAGGALSVLSGGITGVPVETVVQVLDTQAALKAVALPTTSVTYLVRGFAAVGDGGGGFYWWDAASVLADDGGTVIQLNAGGVGRFKKLF